MKRKPKKYISWSQYSLFRRSPDLYEKIYILGEEDFESDERAFGKKIADGLDSSGSDDLEIEVIRTLLPEYPKKEFEIQTEIEGIILKGKLDKFNPKTKAIGEIKTGKKWTQGMVDKWKQLTFYQMLVWGRYGVLSNDIKLFWIPTGRDEKNNVCISGPMRTFKTNRTLSDSLLLLADVRRVKKEIDELWKKHLAGHF